jgi:hypothetical protein
MVVRHVCCNVGQREENFVLYVVTVTWMYKQCTFVVA